VSHALGLAHVMNLIYSWLPEERIINEQLTQTIPKHYLLPLRRRCRADPPCVMQANPSNYSRIVTLHPSHRSQARPLVVAPPCHSRPAVAAPPRQASARRAARGGGPWSWRRGAVASHGREHRPARQAARCLAGHEPTTQEPPHGAGCGRGATNAAPRVGSAS
jgi:hypothetical protein